MNTYQSLFGFTIGPIYEVMSNSKKTRELWFGSYFFSWYTRLLCEKLTEPNYKLILPIINLDEIHKKTRAGFYPDHVIGYSIKPSAEALKELEEIIKSITKNFADRICELIKNEDVQRLSAAKPVLDIIEDYLQTSVVCIEANELNDEKQVVDKIEKILFALEKNRSYSLGENIDTCFRCKSLPSVVKVIEPYDEPDKYNLCPICFFKLRAHKSPELLKITNIRKNKPFPPLAYIITKELHSIREHKEINEKLFSGEVEDLEKKDFKRILNGKEVYDLKTYHKYLAIVNADGDDLGKLVTSHESPSRFSEKLSSFSIKAYDECSKYGVEPIYLGGDDLLVFMPVIYKEYTVFDYILVLQKLYIESVQAKDAMPSISFGVGISYYKYPLSIALEDAQNLLFGTAKNEPGKNSLVLQLTQHSGSRTVLKFSFNEDILLTFNIFLKEVIASEKSGKKLHPHAIHHKLSYFKTLLNSANDVAQIHEFFKNQFNEPVYKTMDGLSTIKMLLIENISSKDDKGRSILYPPEEREKQFDNFLSQIKFIKFLIGD